MGFTVGAITENHKGFRWNALAIAAACVIKIVGYYIAEGFIYGNWVAPVSYTHLGRLPFLLRLLVHRYSHWKQE